MTIERASGCIVSICIVSYVLSGELPAAAVSRGSGCGQQTHLRPPQRCQVATPLTAPPLHCVCAAVRETHCSLSLSDLSQPFHPSISLLSLPLSHSVVGWDGTNPGRRRSRCRSRSLRWSRQRPSLSGRQQPALMPPK